MDLLKKIRNIHKEFIVEVYKRYSGTFEPENYKGIIEKEETLKTLAENPFGNYLLEKIIRAETDRGFNTPLNVDASAIVYFHKSKIYVIFFGLPRQVLNTLNQCPILEDANQKAKSSCKRWKERERLWDQLIGDGPFYENGLYFGFVPDGYPMTLICQQILGG